MDARNLILDSAEISVLKSLLIKPHQSKLLHQIRVIKLLKDDDDSKIKETEKEEKNSKTALKSGEIITDLEIKMAASKLLALNESQSRD